MLVNVVKGMMVEYLAAGRFITDVGYATFVVSFFYSTKLLKQIAEDS